MADDLLSTSFLDMTPEQMQALAAKVRMMSDQFVGGEQDQRYERGMGLLGAALGTLGAPRGSNPLQALGQGGLIGMSAQQQARAARVADRQAGLQQAIQVGNFANMMRQQEIQAALGHAAAGMDNAPPPMPPPGPQGPPVMGAAGGASSLANPTPPSTQPPPSAAPQQGMPGDKFRRLANLAINAGNMQMADSLIKTANEADKNYLFSTTPNLAMQDGKLTPVAANPMGQTRTLGYNPAQEVNMTPAGGSIVPTGKYTGTPTGAPPIPMTLSEKDRQEMGIQRAHLGIEERAQQIALNQNQQALTNTLRSAVEGLPEVKNYRAVVPELNSIVNAPQTNAGDLDVVFSTAHILDPSGVVRKGASDMIFDTSPLGQQMAAYYTKAKGQGGLSPEDRNALIGMATNRVIQMKQAHDAAIQPVIKQAQQNRLPLDQIIVNTPAIQAPKNAQAGPIRAQADAILDKYGYGNR